MIDEKTPNKNYPLPHPDNRASQDVERIATALTMIDADLTGCSEKITAASGVAQKIENDALRIPSELIGKIETEVKNIAARRYVVVNENGTGFTTVEGGGGVGGKKGEVLIKKSDVNFDTTWADPRAILKKAGSVDNVTSDSKLPSNSFSILVDELEKGSDDIAQQGITPQQVTEDVTTDSFCGYILTDEIEDANEDIDLASKTNYGRVKIGDGFDVANGVISVPKTPVATKEAPGVVQIGEGFEVNKGVVSAPAAKLADHENFGIVKLSEDFKTGNNGELLLTKGSTDTAPIIYQAGRKKVVQDSVIRLQVDYAYYRTFIKEDTLFKFAFDFEQTDNIAFDVEIVSDGTYIVSFGVKVVWQMPCVAVTAGVTKIHFEKDICVDQFRGNLIQMPPAQDVMLLTSISTDDVQPNFIAHHNGSGWNACRFFKTSDYSNYQGFTNQNEAIFQLDFVRSTCVDRVEINNGFRGGNYDFFYVEASVDGVNWLQLFEDHDNEPQTVVLEHRGFFRHYRFRTSTNVVLNMARWFGVYVDDNLFELERLMPLMTATSENEYKLTSSTVKSGSLPNLLTADVFSDVRLNPQGAGAAWIQYQLPEAQAVNLIDLGFSNAAMPRWFKIEASNDGTNWDLLLERKQLENFCTGETRQYWLEGTTPYAFYKITALDATSSSWSLGRFRLYKKHDGWLQTNLVPTMVRNSQYGYELSSSSVYNSDHDVFKAFDDDDSTQWATADNAHIGAWLCVKFPTETVCTHARLKARNDRYYPQAASAFEIQGSLDGENFETLKTVSDVSWTQGEEKLIEFFNEKAFLFYRLYVNATQNSNSCAFSAVDFGNDSRAQKKEWCYERKLTPKMTANEQDGFKVTASSIYKGAKTYNPFEAFNEEVSDGSSWTGSSQAEWIQVELPEADTATALRMASGFSKEEPEAFTLYGSTDGENYVVLLDVAGLSWSHNEAKVWTFSNEMAYKFYKISATNTRTNYVTISEIQLLEITQTREY